MKFNFAKLHKNEITNQNKKEIKEKKKTIMTFIVVFVCGMKKKIEIINLIKWIKSTLKKKEKLVKVSFAIKEKCRRGR